MFGFYLEIIGLSRLNNLEHACYLAIAA